MSVLKKFVRKLDLFRRIDETYLSTATAYGGTFTLISYTLMGILLVFELSAYLSSSTSTDVLLDVNQDQSLLINFDITMLALPCDLLAMEVYDRFGWNWLNIKFEIEMTRIHLVKGRYITGASIPKNRVAKVSKDEKEIQDAIKVNEDGHHALDLRGTNFISEVKEHEYTLVNFYTPWCHWCKALAPTYEKAADEFDKVLLAGKKNTKAKFASLNCEMYGDICVKFKIKAYPTLIIFRRDSPIYPVYDGDRTVESLITFLQDAIMNDETPVEDKIFDHACRVKGFFDVPRVPGNFHIEARSNYHDMNPQMANLSHIVHNLQFGETLRPEFESRLPVRHQFLTHPLNEKEFLLPVIHEAPQHYISIVTALYDFRDGSKINSYQFTSQNRIAKYPIDEIPEAKFSYEFSPVSVLVSQRRTSLYSFITYLFAIVGGTFSIISLLEIGVGTVGDTLKRSLGKLN